ncbi:unnamed protein product [Moneuplotes crassus]|uniref:Fibronectin type-III domain-containing protein n=1 Tax=Euplotes crassus TaxID=5936 RepID=A0AAD1Y4W0_EUPCR|nr:unnamed protein product [Moneuplotes crassus]
MEVEKPQENPELQDEKKVKIQVEMLPSKQKKEIYGAPVKKDYLPDILFKEELIPEERLFVNVYMAHFLLKYKDGATSTAIELPVGIPHPTRVIIQHISDRLGLGSIVRGGRKGCTKRLIIAPMIMDKDRFEKAKQTRDSVIEHAVKNYKYKLYDPPEVAIREECYKNTDEQVAKFKDGKNYEDVWNEITETKCAEMKQEFSLDVEKDKALPKDGKDWSLSTEDFKIYISSENKEAVNRDALGDIQAQSNSENHQDEEMEPEESSEDGQSEETGTNNIKQIGIENLTLETFKARPDQIVDIYATKVTEQSAEISWEVPDCNNSEITEYLVKTMEISEDTTEIIFQSMQRTTTPSAVIEDLIPNTWYIVDVRATNEFGTCLKASRILPIKTLIKEKGSLYVWGNQSNAELCLDKSDVNNSLFNKEKHIAMGPLKVNAFKDFVTDIASSDSTTLATISAESNMNLTQAGVTFEIGEEDPTIVYSSGESEKQMFALPFIQNLKSRRGISEQAVKVECGMNFGVALSTTGKVYSWGCSNFGQLGQENNPEKDPQALSEISAVRRPLVIKELEWEDDFVIDIAVGFTHCIALTYRKKIFMWGQVCCFPFNKISDPAPDLYSSSAMYPREIRSVLSDYNPIRVFAGTLFSGILTVDGKLLTFGFGNSGQLGHLDKSDGEDKEFGFLYIPKRVDFFDDYFIEDVSFGGSHILAIARKKIMINEEDFKIEGPREVFAWGSNSKGQCASVKDKYISLPKKIEAFAGQDVLQVAAGIDHSLFLVQRDENNTAVYSCGNAEDGACGVSKSLSGKFSTPQLITMLDKKRKLADSEGFAEVIKLKAGSKTSFAIIGTD